VFSIAEAGLETQKFNSILKNIVGPSIIIVETKKQAVFGVFLDRSVTDYDNERVTETCLLSIKPESKSFNHQKGQQLNITLDLKFGLQLHQKE